MFLPKHDRSGPDLYSGYGHGNDQGNPDYNVQVDRLVRRVYAQCRAR